MGRRYVRSVLRWMSLLGLGVLCTPLAAQTPSAFEIAARSRGTPDFPGLNMIWLTPWIDVVHAREWRNIVVHQSEGAAGSAWRGAVAQMRKPDRKGTTIWVETDGTVYWAVAEFAVPNHIRSGNRRDNCYIDNASTFRQILRGFHRRGIRRQLSECPAASDRRASARVADSGAGAARPLRQDVAGGHVDVIGR